MSLLTDIADSVVTEINATDWTEADESFTADRVLKPVVDPADLENLRVAVVLREFQGRIVTRGKSERRIAIQVVCQRKLQDTNELNDPIVNLANEIADHFEAWRSPAGHAVVSVELQPIYAADHLKDQIITSVAVLNFLAFVPRS